MVYTSLFLFCAFFPEGDDAPKKDLARDPFLRPYIQQLKQNTSADDLRKITAMARSELITLHHGFGTGIRNRWIRGGRDPALVRFFRTNKINDPDRMSMVVIEAIWIDLNSSLSQADRTSVEKKRAVVARKRATYAKLESECESHLKQARDAFERCYASYGLPSKNSALRHPFFKLLVDNSGRVREIQFFEGASPKLKPQLAKIINAFTFSAFTDDDLLTLYIIDFPSCRVAERDALHR
jgi:hypothetical protein